MDRVSLHQISATKSHRFTNYFVDTIVVRIIMEITQWIFLPFVIEAFTKTDTIEISTIGIGLFSIIPILAISVGYYWLMEAIWGKTVGKLLSKTIVVNEQGEIVSSKDAFIRSLCRLIPFEAFSFLGGQSVATRGWHDTISKTYVVYQEQWETYKNKGGSSDLIDMIGRKDEDRLGL